MMLVLRWRSLGLVAAPLVSNLGLVALTSSSVTLDAADAVVASTVVTTAPALAPAAADTVVLAVMRSGWMWAGSLAGSSLDQVRAGASQQGRRHSTAQHGTAQRSILPVAATRWQRTLVVGVVRTWEMRAMWHARQQSVSVTFCVLRVPNCCRLGRSPL